MALLQKSFNIVFIKEFSFVIFSFLICLFMSLKYSFYIFYLNLGSIMGDSSITIICYINGNMVNAPNGVCYNCSPSKAMFVNSSTSFNELVARLCELLCGGSSEVMLKLKLVNHYLINLGDGNFNFVALLINDDDDVSLMCNVATKFLTRYTIEMYVEILPIEMENIDCILVYYLIHHKKMVGVDNAVEIGENDDDEPMIKIDSNVVQDMMMNEGYVYEDLGNHDIENNDVEIFEHVEHQRMHLDHEYCDVPNPGGPLTTRQLAETHVNVD